MVDVRRAPSLCNSGMVGSYRNIIGLNIILTIPYSHYYTVGGLPQVWGL